MGRRERERDGMRSRHGKIVLNASLTSYLEYFSQRHQTWVWKEFLSDRLLEHLIFLFAITLQYDMTFGFVTPAWALRKYLKCVSVITDIPIRLQIRSGAFQGGDRALERSDKAKQASLFPSVCHRLGWVRMEGRGQRVAHNKHLGADLGSYTLSYHFSYNGNKWIVWLHVAHFTFSDNTSMQ